MNCKWCNRPEHPLELLANSELALSWRRHVSVGTAPLSRSRRANVAASVIAESTLGGLEFSLVLKWPCGVNQLRLEELKGQPARLVMLLQYHLG